MALQAYGTSGDPVLAEVALDPTGAVTVRSNAVDMGNGSATTLGLAVAEALGANATAVALGDAALWAALDLTTTAPAGWADPRYVRKDTSSSSSCLTAFHQAHAARAATRAWSSRRAWSRPRPASGAARGRRSHRRAGATARSSPTASPRSRAPPSRAGYRRRRRDRALVHAYYQAGWVEADYTVEGATRRWPLTGLVLRRGSRREQVRRADRSAA